MLFKYFASIMKKLPHSHVVKYTKFWILVTGSDARLIPDKEEALG